MDTIAAISTGNIVSAIGILRLSGPESSTIADRVFRPADGRPLSAHPLREMVYGTLMDTEGRTLDRCMAVRFGAGRSYTGEDSAEFHCHGSPVVLSEGLRALFSLGARQAGRGEFTKRAFLSGNLDLTQAEAVIDLIESETPLAARNAVEQLGGTLRRQIDGVYQLLLDLNTQFCAVVDYPDEDIEDVSAAQIAQALKKAEAGLRELLATFDRGSILKSGVPTAIIGRPNVGKSSLLNALLGRDRAIVTDVAGTTRDTVEEMALVGGVLLRLIDTAGIRDTGDQVERIGVERARAAAEGSALALLVLDGSAPLTKEDQEAAGAAGNAKSCIVLLNKSDKPQAVDLDALRGQFPCVLPISAKEGLGLADLGEAVRALFPAGDAPAGSILTNARQAEAVARAADAIRSAREALESGLTPDAVLTDVEDGLRALGELTGRTVRDDLVDSIFSRFCVGK